MAAEAAPRRYRTREEAFNDRRLFRCSKCTQVGGVDAFTWSRQMGARCHWCHRYVYVLAERGPSPYQDWPWPNERKLTTTESLVLLTEHREEDGMLFLTAEDLAFYERLTALWRRR